MNDRKEFLTTKQVSIYLCIPLRTVYHLAKQGKIKSIRIGSKIRYLKNDIELYQTFGTDFSKEPARRPDNSADRRIYPRINCSLPCYIRVIIPQKKEISAMAKILNISEGGIFIENYCNKEEFLNIRADDPMEVKFELDKTAKLNTDGRVLRIQDKGIAVKFKRINSESREIIREYVG